MLYRRSLKRYMLYKALVRIPMMAEDNQIQLLKTIIIQPGIWRIRIVFSVNKTGGVITFKLFF